MSYVVEPIVIIFFLCCICFNRLDGEDFIAFIAAFDVPLHLPLHLPLLLLLLLLMITTTLASSMPLEGRPIKDKNKQGRFLYKGKGLY